VNVTATFDHVYPVYLQLSQAETDMWWDDGTRNVEPVMDIYAPNHISLVCTAAAPVNVYSLLYLSERLIPC
jgi:hypothetical protein